MRKKLLILSLFTVILVLVLSSCFMLSASPDVKGYVQYYDGSTFTTDSIKVTLEELGNVTTPSSVVVAADSKGYYSFSGVKLHDKDNFFSLIFEKNGNSAEFEFEKLPLYSEMTTIAPNDICGYIHVNATHVGADMENVGVEVVRKSDGKLFFSRPFQRKWDDGTYSDGLDVPEGDYSVKVFYYDSSMKKITVKSTDVSLTAGNSKDVNFDLEK